MILDQIKFHYLEHGCAQIESCDTFLTQWLVLGWYQDKPQDVAISLTKKPINSFVLNALLIENYMLTIRYKNISQSKNRRH